MDAAIVPNRLDRGLYFGKELEFVPKGMPSAVIPQEAVRQGRYEDFYRNRSRATFLCRSIRTETLSKVPCSLIRCSWLRLL